MVQTNAAPSRHEHDQMSVPTAIPFRRESSAPVEAPVPIRDSSDATKLKFPIGTVAAIVGTAIGVVTAQNLSQADMKSDVRDILTRMEYQSKIDEADKRAQDVIYEAMKQDLGQLRAQVQLLQLQYAELNKQMRR